MKWSYEVARLFGIPLRVHVTFLLLLLLVAMVSGQAGEAGTPLNGVLTVLLIFTCVVVHELAHSLMARHYGVNVRAIVLLPIGGVSQMEQMPEDPSQEIKVSVVGPLTSFALAVVFLILASLAGQDVRLWPFSITDPDILASLFRINFFLGMFNIFPAFPMDGGRVLRGVLATRLGEIKATRIAVEIGQALAVLMIFYGVFRNWWLALIGIFIYLGAEGEEHATMLRAALRNVPVTRAMLTDIHTVSPRDSLGSVVEKACHSLQADFPVVEEDNVIGILPKEVIFAAIHQQPPETPVSAIMKTDFLSAERGETLDHIFQKMQGQGVSLVPIIEGGKLLGMINLEQIGKFHMMCGTPGR